MGSRVDMSTGADRRSRFYDLTDSRKVTKPSSAANVMLGALSVLIDDVTWDDALKCVEQVTI